ncbi:MAG TPA: hypothetical protein VKV02_13830 [Acidobacteriaceae bacterium]|nr:hypothetical protein [Acidobacteriaceae bacterium]
MCVGGDLDHLTQAQGASCSAKVQAVRGLVTSLHAPDNWHFVVVCGESGWKDYTDYVGATDGHLLNAAADTNFERHETFLREDRLDLGNAPAFRRSVAHEVAGILLHSKDEVAINTQVNHWMNQLPQQSGF